MAGKFPAGQRGPDWLSLPATLTMKKHLRPLTLAFLLLWPVAPILRAQEKPGHKEPETELGRTMEKFNGAWRKLRKQVADPASNASSLELAATIKAGLEKGLTLKPAKAEDVPAAEREKFIQAYQDKLKEFIALLPKLEAALQANDNATAQALVQKMGAAQREDHKEFRRPEM
jgi:Cytochrome b562